MFAPETIQGRKLFAEVSYEIADFKKQHKCLVLFESNFYLFYRRFGLCRCLENPDFLKYRS